MKVRVRVKEKMMKSEDNEDNHFQVDEENIIPDIEVYMKDFYISINLEVEFLEKKE